MFTAFSCEKENEDIVCLEGKIIFVNYCTGEEDVFNVLIQILNSELKIGDTITLNNQIFNNVVECYNFPPAYIDKERIYFSYKNIKHEDIKSRPCLHIYLYIHAEKGIYILSISDVGCEYLQEVK